MSPATQTELLTLFFIVFVVARFLVRELRARSVRIARLWIRPAVLLAAAAFLIGLTFAVPPGPGMLLAPSLAAGVAVGALVGYLVARSTSIERTDQAGTVRLRGSWVTVVVWLAALALRTTARFFIAGSLIAQSPAVNAGTVLLVAVAFSTFALLVARRVRALGLA